MSKEGWLTPFSFVGPVSTGIFQKLEYNGRRKRDKHLSGGTVMRVNEAIKKRFGGRQRRRQEEQIILSAAVVEQAGMAVPAVSVTPVATS